MFKYNPESKLLEEQASMERPPDYVTAEYGTLVHKFWDQKWEAYNAHLSSLRKYPVQQNTIWDEVKEYELGRDFEVCEGIPIGWTPSFMNPPDDAPIETFAIPISQEDDLKQDNESLRDALSSSETIADGLEKSNQLLKQENESLRGKLSEILQKCDLKSPMTAVINIGGIATEALKQKQ